MFSPGLVSVSFRRLCPAEIIDLCVESGLAAIEWGGDIHVPPGDMENAGKVSRMTTEAGLRVAAYGSYYRVGNPENTGTTFQEVLDTAVTLGALRIRVWAGTKGSAQATEEDWKNITGELSAIAETAERENVQVCLEYHSNTFTDSLASVDRLLAETPETVRFLWQPSSHYSMEERLAGLPPVLPRLAHAHVYYWFPGNERQPLAAGEKEWMPYLKLLGTAGREVDLLLEFVRDDSAEQLRADAATLRSWIQSI
jgi:3-dehydroshikimate dehydratase